MDCFTDCDVEIQPHWQRVTQDGQSVVIVPDDACGTWRSRLQVCKDSLFHEIFPKRLSAADNVGLVSFDDKIGANNKGQCSSSSYCSCS